MASVRTGAAQTQGAAPGTEVAARADFSRLRYGMCWEDADILVAGLDVRPGDTCVSIASAGDNALALLSRDPERVIAVDLSPAQMAALELRIAAYKTLAHDEMLELLGARPSSRRPELYRRARTRMPSSAQAFWDAQRHAMDLGAIGVGKFESYFSLFRRRVLPLIHGRARVEKLLAGGSRDERIAFYNDEWDTARWRLMFRLFFSRTLMGRLGRDPEFFRYVEGSVADRILARTKHALTELDPRENPYLQMILTGTHRTALPLALRPEHFDRIRSNLDRLELHLGPLEAAVAKERPGTIDRFNLSDIFEYMAPDVYESALAGLAGAGRGGGRLAYWNMLAPRSRPDSMAHQLVPLTSQAKRLHQQDKAFFYSAFILEEVQ